MPIIAKDIFVHATMQQLADIERLLHSSTYEQKQIEWIETRYLFFSEFEAEEVIKRLSLNQQQTDQQQYERLRWIRYSK
jgi:hypothetical protein